jgi:hypothetical protein
MQCPRGASQTIALSSPSAFGTADMSCPLFEGVPKETPWPIGEPSRGVGASL